MGIESAQGMSDRQGQGGENEPLFSASSASENGYERGSSDGIDLKSLSQNATADGSDDDIEVYGSDTPAADYNARFPPPKYQQSAREYEFEADDGVLQDGEGGELPELHGEGRGPRIQGLLGNAAARGSIDIGRRESVQSNESIEEGLVVGGGGGGILSSVSNMSNSILGAGIIGLPYAVREAGFFTGLILLVVLGIVTDWTIRLVVVNAKLTGKKSYIDIMESCFGFPGRALVSFFQFSFAFGGMCAFAVILGDTIPHVLTSVFTSFADTTFGTFIFSRQFVVLITTIFVSYPLSLYRDIEKLSKASALALISMMIIVLTVMIQGPSLPSELKGDSSSQFTFIESGVFEATGVISFAYVCHHNSLLIYGSLRTPTLDRWNKVTHISTGLSVVASLIMAIAGYSVFTDKTRGNILNNFPSDHFWANIARLCFGLNMMTTTPLEAFVCREVFESFFYPDQPFEQRRHVIVTTSLIVMSMLISMMTCDLGLVLEITGGFGATCLAFIFPAACSLKLSGDPYARAKWPAWACVCFGVVVMVLATLLSIVKSGS